MIVNAFSIVQHVIQIKYRIIKHANVKVKIIVSAKKTVAGILADIFKGNSKYSKSIADTPVITCDGIVSVMDDECYTTNVTSTSSISCHSEKIRYKVDCYNFCTQFY